MVCAVCSAPSLSTPAQSEPPPPSDSANQLQKDDGQVIRGEGVCFLSNGLNFDPEFSTSTSDWVDQEIASVLHIGIEERTTVFTIPPTGALSFSMPATAGDLPDGLHPELTVWAKGKLVVSIAGERGETFKEYLEGKGITLTCCEDSSHLTHSYGKPDEPLPQLFVTIYNPDLETGVTGVSISFAVSGESTGRSVVAARTPEPSSEKSVPGESTSLTAQDGRVSEGRIAFLSSADGQPDLYVMNPDGTEKVRLTNSPEREERATWSPDGTKIAFDAPLSRRGRGLFIANADGSDQTELKTVMGNAQDPAWSPDGSRIAFTSDRDGIIDPLNRAVAQKLYTMNSDGTGAALVTERGNRDSNPAWSPDGTKIAVKSGGKFLTLYSADGSFLSPISNVRSEYWAPSWSPDGERILSTVDGNLYVANADASGGTWLTDDYHLKYHPSWSPDGQRIVFSSYRGSDQEIFVMNADGSEVKQLTDNEVYDSEPSWSPDGQRIVFVSFRDGGDLREGGGDIYVMHADGSDVVRITETSRNQSPVWSPR